LAQFFVAPQIGKTLIFSFDFNGFVIISTLRHHHCLEEGDKLFLTTRFYGKSFRH